MEHLGLVSAGTTTKASGLSRDLWHRAIEVMAGAEALGEFVSLTAEESFAIEDWPLALYKLSLTRPRRTPGQGGRGSRGCDSTRPAWSPRAPRLT